MTKAEAVLLPVLYLAPRARQEIRRTEFSMERWLETWASLRIIEEMYRERK
jgi:hypothetical protein